MKKQYSLFFILFIFLSCSNKQQEAENKALKNENEYLKKEIVNYQTTPQKMIIEAIGFYKNHKLDSLRSIEKVLLKYHSESKEYNDIKEMISKLLRLDSLNKIDKDKERNIENIHKVIDDFTGITWYQFIRHQKKDGFNIHLKIGKKSSEIWMNVIFQNYCGKKRTDSIVLTYGGETFKVLFDKSNYSYEASNIEILQKKSSTLITNPYMGTSGLGCEIIDLRVSESLLTYLRKLIVYDGIPKIRFSSNNNEQPKDIDYFFSKEDLIEIETIINTYDILKNKN